MYILGVRVDNLTKKEVLVMIHLWLTSIHKTGHQIITLNPEFVLVAQKNHEFKNIINSASLVVADGIGILWAEKFLSLKFFKNIFLRLFQIIFRLIYTLLGLIFYPRYCKIDIHKKITGADLFLDISELAVGNNQSIFLLGGFGNTAETTALKLHNKYPRLKIAGTYGGVLSPFQYEEEAKIINLINAANPDILMVAYGQVKQEKWIYKNLSRLSSVKAAMGVGGTFDFISCRIKRAPKWLQNLGLEWLFRLFVEPKLRFRRIINATFVFIYKIAVYKYRVSN